MSYCNGITAGYITEDETVYTFAYDKDYLAKGKAMPVSLTMPLREEPYHNNVMFSFFDGLIPEGWMLNEPKWNDFIDISYISPTQKEEYKKIIHSHLKDLQ